MTSNLSSLLTQLAIPAHVDSSSQDILESPEVEDLEQWTKNAIVALRDLLRLLKNGSSGGLPLEEQGNIIFAVNPFNVGIKGGSPSAEPKERWSTHEAQRLSQDILSLPTFAPPPRELIVQILSHNLKPIFRASPHPRLNTETGRSLNRPAGGSTAMQDYYEGQKWKKYPGIDKVVLWCVQEMRSEDYERMWHLVIPPVMTLLDDYEVSHKLEGVLVVQEMLRHIPKDLLKRTGVDQLMFSALRNCLSHLDRPETPQLLREAISASVALTLQSTSVGVGQASSKRFDELSSLLGEGIISGIWLYAEDKPEVVLATFDSLPAVLAALGIGSVRFLQSVIPQLAHTLIPRKFVDPNRELQLSAIRVLNVILDVCRPRMSVWKETILSAVGRCWVELVDSEKYDQHSDSATGPNLQLKDQVKQGLCGLCLKLATVCPSVLQDEYPRLLAADHKLFDSLLVKSIQAQSQEHREAATPEAAHSFL